MSASRPSSIGLAYLLQNAIDTLDEDLNKKRLKMIDVGDLVVRNGEVAEVQFMSPDFRMYFVAMKPSQKHVKAFLCEEATRIGARSEGWTIYAAAGRPDNVAAADVVELAVTTASEPAPLDFVRISGRDDWSDTGGRVLAYRILRPAFTFEIPNEVPTVTDAERMESRIEMAALVATEMRAVANVLHITNPENGWFKAEEALRKWADRLVGPPKA